VRKVIIKAEKPQVFKELRQVTLERRYSVDLAETPQIWSLHLNDEDGFWFFLLGTASFNHVVWPLPATIRDLNFRLYRVRLIFLLKFKLRDDLN